MTTKQALGKALDKRFCSMQTVNHYIQETAYKKA
jgi:hypothetical protein